MTTHTFVGNLAADPEFHTGTSKKLSARLRVACSERYFDRRDGTWKSTPPVFWTAYAWEKRAELIRAQGWVKGQAVIIVGSFTSHKVLDPATGELKHIKSVSIDAVGENALLPHRKSSTAAEDAEAAQQPAPGAVQPPVDAEAEAGL